MSNLLQRLVKIVTRRPVIGGGRPGRARALAARGLGPADIARQTGLSRDAVVMLLIAESVDRGRRNLPRSA